MDRDDESRQTLFSWHISIRHIHWVCINCPPSVVDVFHSAPHCSSTSKVLLKQAASLAQCQDKLRFIDVHVQEGSDDCRVFAITFATALCDHVDPHSLSLDQKKCVNIKLIALNRERSPLSATPRRFGPRRVKNSLVPRPHPLALREGRSGAPSPNSWISSSK